MFSSSKPVTEEAQHQAVSDLRQQLAPQAGEPSVEELLRTGGEPNLIGEGLDEETLRRWLRAENFNVKKAGARLRAHATWRASYVPQGRILQVPR